MRFLFRRLAFYALAAWAAITINFVIPHLLPSNPVQAMMARHPEFPPPLGERSSSSSASGTRAASCISTSCISAT